MTYEKLLLSIAVALLAGCSASPRAREAAHMTRGRKFAASNEFRKAVIEFKVASQNMPKDPEPVYQLGMTYLRAGAAELAVESFVKALRLDPRHEGARYQMALVEVNSDKPEVIQESKRVLTAFLATHPDDGEALGALSLAFARSGDKPEMLRAIGMAEEKDPANIRAAERLVEYFVSSGQPGSAAEVTRYLTGRFEKSPDLAILRARVALTVNDSADADAQITHALALQRDFRPALQLRLRRELTKEDSRASAEETTRELAQLPDRQSWGSYARLLFGEGKVDEGIAEYSRVLKAHNNDPELRDEYSALLIHASRNKEAAAIIAETLTRNPKDRPALLQRATTRIDDGNLTGAAADIRTLRTMGENSAELNYQDSRVAGSRGETTKQVELLANALRSSPGMLKARLELANALTKAGQMKLALNTLETASEEEKQSLRYAYYRNLTLIAAGNYDEARQGVKAALARSPSAGFLGQDAMVRIRTGDLAGARKSLESAIQLAPADVAVLNLLGDVMKRQNEGAKFVSLLREDAAKHPESAALQELLGKQLMIAGDRDGARAAFEAERKAGEPGKADEAIAFLEMRTGEPERARQRLLELVKVHDSAPARFMLAEIETQKKASAEVIAGHYLRALEMEPTNAAAMNNLANLLVSRQGKFDDALFWALKALALAPGNPAIEDTVGWVYYKLGKVNTALTYLKNSLKQADQPWVHYHLAGALLAAGDPGGGRREYELGLKLDPGSEVRAAVAPLFEAK